MSEYSAELRLKEPLTKEDWDLIADADFKNTNKVIFTTPHCGEVEFVKVVRCKDCVYGKPFRGFEISCARYGLCDFEWYCAFGERSEE